MTPEAGLKNRSGAVVAIAGLVLMRAFFAVYPVYQPTGPDLLPSLAAPGAWKGLESPGVLVRDSAEGVVLRLTAVSNRAPSLEYALASVGAAEAFRVRAECRTEALVHGTHRYQVGRVFMAFVDAAGKSLWHRAHLVVAIEGTRGWHEVSRRFTVPDEAVAARVILANQGRAGVLEIRGLSVVPLCLNPWTPTVFVGWGMIWGSAVWIAARRLRLVSRPGGRAVLAAALAAIAGMLLPDRAIGAAGTGMRHTFAAMERAVRPAIAAPAAPSTSAAPAKPHSGGAPEGSRIDAELRAALAGSLDIHKVGHVAVFAWLTIAVAACFGLRLAGRGRESPWVAVGGILLFAVAAEQLQWLTLTRSARIGDIGFNAVGMAAGLLLAIGWRRLRRRRGGETAEPSGRIPAGSDRVPSGS